MGESEGQLGTMALTLTPVYESATGDFIPIGSRMTGDEIDAFLRAVLAYGNDQPIPSEPVDVLYALSGDTLGTRILAGGLLVRSDAVLMEPGCCCGLEEWSLWFDAIDGRVMPTFGHNPVVWTERCGEDVLIHGSLGDSEDGNQPFDILRVSTGELLCALQEVEGQWRAVLGAVASFASANRAGDIAGVVCANLDRWFGRD